MSIMRRRILNYLPTTYYTMNKRDKFYFAYFLLHIPITLLIDSCLVIPREYRLDIQNQLADFHISTNKDFLLADPPLWLQIFGVFELFFQLPFFAVGACGLWQQWRSIYVGLTVYGFNAFLTTLVCLVYIEAEGVSNGLSNNEVVSLSGMYTPYLLIPLVMMIDCGVRLMSYISEAQQAEEEGLSEKKTI